LEGVSVTRARYAVIAFLITVVITAAWFLSKRSKGKPDSTLNLSGTIEATTVAPGFKVNGRLSKRLVDEGEAVISGQVLAKLETDDLQLELALRQADLRVATELLKELEAGSRREEVAQAEAALDRIKSEENRVETDYARQEELFRREVIASRDFEKSHAVLLSIHAQAREANERLKLLRNGPRPETIRQARARVDSLRSALELSRRRLSDATLLSPTTGTVLAKHLEPGELVNNGTPVVTIGDLDTVWVRAYIPEAEIGKIRQGLEAQVSSDTFPGRSYRGIVSFISPEAEFTPKNVQTQKERVKLVFRIKIKVQNSNRELKPGMPVDAVLISR
jgi:HlyD family secretion protein